MREILHNIQQVIKPTKLQKIQDDISLATELAVITVDYRGAPLTEHSNCSSFCKKIRTSKTYGVYCEKCDSRGGLEAARNKEPFIYFCHAGIIDFAIPIIVDNLYLGAFMAGQVKLDPRDIDNDLEQLASGSYDKSTMYQMLDLQKDYDNMAVMRMDKISALANTLSLIGNCYIEKTILRSTMEKDSTLIYHPSGNNPSNNKTSDILQPAMDYITKHSHEKITLSQMAAQCNISPSYFSKLFAKKNLGNLSHYVNQLKIEHAKDLLINTDMPVSNIADKIGFDDCSYFIKVFKKHTTKTPSQFRNHLIIKKLSSNFPSNQE